MAENAGSVRPPAHRAERSSLGPRLASALVLIPLALAAVWFGGLWIALLVTLAAGLMSWEWGGLVGRLANSGDTLLFLGIGAASVLASVLVSVPAGLLVGAAGIIGPSIGFVWLRADPASGFAVTLWLLAVVWATDILAYAAGKTIGGPRLAPRISPNKTWAGLIGGVAGAMLAGLATGLLLPETRLWMVVGLSGGLAVVEQIGDIAESFAKRRFGVKDSGRLIPGHGGLLDRLDGMLAVVAVIVLLRIVTDGNILRWHQA
jgi:phosphatidate cytidylyltransferase